MFRKTILFLMLILGNMFGLSGFAQKNIPAGLVLEITYFKGRPPAYKTISSSAAEVNWSWYALFNRVPDFKNSADRPPVRAVKFVPYLENETVKIKVSVFTGIRFHDNEENVGVYTGRENDRITIKELADFGVEPFEVTIVRIAPAAPVLPTVVNKTNSLQVVGIEPNSTALPSYTVRLLNNSEKAVIAFAFETEVNGKMQLSSMPHNQNGAALIKPGEVFEKKIPSALENRKISSDQIPPVLSNQMLVIRSVVFQDGAYEGEAGSVTRFRGFVLGRKLQLKQIISFIQAAENKREKLDLNELAEQALKLGISSNEMQNSEFLKDFPELNEKEKPVLTSCAEIAANAVKKDFVKALEMEIQESASNSILNWLKMTREQYQNWLKELP